MSLDFNNQVTVVVAVTDRGRWLEPCVQALSSSFKKILLVSPPDNSVIRKAKSLELEWVIHDSLEVQALWRIGIEKSSTPWILLLRSNEIATALLKENILDKVSNGPGDDLSIFPLKLTTIFLKKRTKYPLIWNGEPPSALVYIHPQSVVENFFSISAKKPLKGELLSFREETVVETFSSSLELAEDRADRLFRTRPGLSKTRLTWMALTGTIKTFFRSGLFQKAWREGFEGLIFTVAECRVTLGTCLHYYEKYVRGGGQITDQINTIRNVLVVKLRGIGDNVISTPLIKTIKHYLPETSISVLTYDYCKPLYEKNPHIDNLFGLSVNPGKAESKRLVRVLNEKGFDLTLNLHARNFSSKLIRKIRSRWRISSSYFLRDKFTDVLVGSPDPARSALERDLDCLRQIGLEPKDKRTELHLSQGEIDWANRYYSDHDVDRSRKIVVLHPWATLEIREWGLKKFGELARILIQEHQCQVLVVCDETELPKSMELGKYVSGLAIFQGPLRKLMALIHEADLVIDNDSGPSHLAVAFNTPTIVLAGNEPQGMYRDPETYQGQFHVFFKDVPCRDMLSTKCFTPAPCDNRICLDFSVEEVAAKSVELLNTRNKEKKKAKRNSGGSKEPVNPG